MTSTDEDRTAETYFAVPMFSVFNKYNTFCIKHALFETFSYLGDNFMSPKSQMF